MTCPYHDDFNVVSGKKDKVIRGIYAHVLRRLVPQPVLDFIRARMPGGNRTAGAATAAAEDRWGTAARSADRVQNEWRGQLDVWELEGIEQKAAAAAATEGALRRPG